MLFLDYFPHTRCVFPREAMSSVPPQVIQAEISPWWWAWGPFPWASKVLNPQISEWTPRKSLPADLSFYRWANIQRKEKVLAKARAQSDWGIHVPMNLSCLNPAYLGMGSSINWLAPWSSQWRCLIWLFERLWLCSVFWLLSSCSSWLLNLCFRHVPVLLTDPELPSLHSPSPQVW